MSKKIKKVWLTEAQKNLVRGVDLNDWQPVLVPSFFRLNVEDKELWPKIYVKNVQGTNGKVMQLLGDAMTGDPLSIVSFCKSVVEKVENYRDIETGKEIKKVSDAIDTMPIKWLAEIIKASQNGGCSEEELTGVKS